MSNTSGQATLLDGAGTVVAQSDPYDTAPDGQAWALANGTWYWATKPTPAATNVIAQPIKLPATALKVTKAAAARTTKVKAASTKTVKSSTAKPKVAATTPVKQASFVLRPTTVHPGVLALVGACAVGYGAYVYRKDLANAVRKLRRH
ncbi:hypothetical protein IPL85_01185 [Candidatus Saccharibacteria bacterium]|nr:MAG: hypothetical protein IPL85_01185 [Candidatus Saccharibacteria bacterium]